MALQITQRLICQAIGRRRPYLSTLDPGPIPAEAQHTLALTSNISIWVVEVAHLALEETVVALAITPNKVSQGLTQLR